MQPSPQKKPKNAKALRMCFQQPFQVEEDHRLLGRRVILIGGSKGNKPLKFFLAVQFLESSSLLKC